MFIPLYGVSALYCPACYQGLVGVMFVTIMQKKKHKIITGCSAYGVALCDDSKRSCWQEWHKQP